MTELSQRRAAPIRNRTRRPKPILFRLYGLMLAITVALMLGFGCDLAGVLSVERMSLARQLGLGTAAGLAGVAISRALLWFSWAREMQDSLLELVSGFGIRPQQIFGLTLLNAFAEELLFRGFLQPFLGLWLTSILFALPHVPHRWALLPWPFLAAGMGALFGWLTLLSGSILPAFAAHFVINYFNLHQILGEAEAHAP